MRRLILFFTLIALAQHVSAWGPTANKAFCRDSVAGVWGQDALRCLQERTAYCLEVKDVVGATFSQMCLDAYAAGIEIDPATAPSSIFNDVNNFYNYDSCPLKWSRYNNVWVCNASGNPAGDTARLWFNAAERTSDICSKVREFCSGAFYLASSYYPLHQVTYLQGCVSGSPDEMIDHELLAGGTNWSVESQCTFQYLKPMAGVSRIQQQHVTFIITKADYDLVMAKVQAEASYVKDPSRRPISASTATSTTETTSTTESTTSTTQQVTSTSTTATSTTATTTSLTTTSTTESTTTTTLAESAPTTSSTSTSESTTSTAPTTTLPRVVDTNLNQSINEIDSMVGNMITTFNKTKNDEPKAQNNITVLAVIALVIMLSLVILVYLYSLMRRPHVHSRRVILPPSVRRRMRKNP
jgi:hypothetical protein